MAKILRLYNTFTRKLTPVTLNGKLVTSIGGDGGDEGVVTQRPQLLTGSFYICGPTVYSDTHLGHALTYIRADLFRRFLRSYFNVHLTTVMNITDIDDKILIKCLNEYTDLALYCRDPNKHPFRRISDKYYASFINDLKTLRVLPADVFVRISENMNHIMKFINRLEKNGQAYIGSDGDLYFRVNSVDNYHGRVDKRDSRNKDVTTLDKKDQRDFVLWKGAKDLEPVWEYQSAVSSKVIAGRPGWHVQCSAISSAFFGSHLDFHYGGKDLIFPHHYNEEACSCAFHQLDTTSSLHVWCQNWLHSSHLTIKHDRDGLSDGSVEKMSKSLNNVIPIKNFSDKSSVNTLRLLCVLSHYRSDLEYSGDLIEMVKGLNHKLNALHNFLADKISQLSVYPENIATDAQSIHIDETNPDLEAILLKTANEIVDGICDDFNLRKGLDSILTLARYIYSVSETDKLRPKDLVACWSMLSDWCKICGLVYADNDCDQNSTMRNSLHLLIRDFRHRVRLLALNEIKANSSNKKHTQDPSTDVISRKLLQECDKIRSQLDELGIIERDPSSNEKHT